MLRDIFIYKSDPKYLERLLKLVIIILASWGPTFSYCQCPSETGDACSAIRYIAGDSWNGDGSVNVDSGGIVKCNGMANTHANLAPNAFYCDSSANLPELMFCTDHTSGEEIALTPPEEGQEVLWFNFDVRPQAGSYFFQLLCGADSVGWALFYSNSPTDSVNSNGLSGDCSDLTFDRCGTHFNTWPDQAFPTPDLELPTNYYLLVWDLEDEDFLVNFNARYGCGDGPGLCVLDTAQVLAECQEDGTTRVTVDIIGINGTYLAKDPSATTISSEVVLTNLQASTPTLDGSFSLTYPAGTDYNISIIEIADTTGNSDSCRIDITGTTPICNQCAFEMTCPTFDQAVVACYSDIPDKPSYTESEFEALGDGNGNIGDEPCGAIEITASNGPAPDCSTGGDVRRVYTITEYQDVDQDGLKDDPAVVLTVDSCVQTIAVAASDLALSACPTTVNFSSCSDQSAVDEAFANWIGQVNDVEVAGGCAPDEIELSVDPSSLSSPDICSTDGTSYMITISVDDACGATAQCTTEFTVAPAAAPLALEGCPNDVRFRSCSRQDDVTSAFEDWVDSLTSITTNGACAEGQVIFNIDPNSLAAPDVCSVDGTMYSVTASVQNPCGDSIECTSKFEVSAYSAASITGCPEPISFTDCESQDVVTAAFETWVDSLNGLIGLVGCFSGSMTFDVDPSTLPIPDVCSTEGTSYSVTAVIEDPCSGRVTCTSTFMVAASAGPVSILGCPQPINFSTCTNQSIVSISFAAWQDSMINLTTEGGCSDASLSFDIDPASLMEPDVCSSEGTNYSVTASISDPCSDMEVECTSTFVVVAYEDDVSIVGCPDSIEVSTCIPQSEMETKFTQWKESLQSMTALGGCECGAIIFDVDLDGLATPDVCSSNGLTYHVTGTASDDCGSSASCSSSFIVTPYSEEVSIVGCPDPVYFGGCADQDDVTASFNAWITALNDLQGIGGCNCGIVSYNVDPNSLDAPDVCTDETIFYQITGSVTDECGSTAECVSTFRVDVGTAQLALTGCPENVSVTSCAEPGKIAEAFNLWVSGLKNISVSGGCTELELVFSTHPDSLEVPSGCGQEPITYTVTTSVTDDCSGASTDCTSTFTVGAYDNDLVLTGCPESVNFASCANPAELSQAFDDWIEALGQISATGGCNCCAVVYSVDPTTLASPNVCSASPIVYEVTASVTDDCGGTAKCTSTFKMDAYEDNVELSGCPENVSFPACSDQDAVSIAFDKWVADLNAITVDGGCNCGAIQFDTDPNSLAQPSVCSNEATSYTIKASVSDGCGGTDMNSSTFYVGAYTNDVAITGCPTPIAFDACTDPSEVSVAFKGWIAALKAMRGTGGCECGLVQFDVDPSALDEPTVCGNVAYSVTGTVTDACGGTAQCTSTFKVESGADAVQLSPCPEDQHFGPCSDQSEMAIAFNKWIADLNAMTASGGCGDTEVKYSIDPNILTVCNVCSPTPTKYSVMISVYDECGNEDWCTAKFEVAGYSHDLDIVCPPSKSFAACEDEEEVAQAFESWRDGLLSIQTTGGCSAENVTYSLDPNGFSAPDACSPDATAYSVTVSITDNCGGKAECTTSFDVAAQVDDLALSACPASVHLPACSDQTEVNSALAAWIEDLMNVSATGSCNPGDVQYSVDLNSIGTCDACSLTPTVYIVKVTVEDDCGGKAECESKFEVAAVTPVSVECPDPEYYANSIGGCADSSEIAAAFANWISGFKIVDPGCGLKTSTDLKAFEALAECSTSEQQIVVTYQASDGCTTDECTATFTIGASDEIVLDCSELIDVVECAADVIPGSPKIVKGCGPVALTVSGPEIDGIPDCDGTTYTFVHTAEDACGNKETCTQVITVRNEPPSIDCTAGSDLDLTCGDDYAKKIADWIIDTEASLEVAVKTSCACGFTIANDYDGSVPSSGCDIANGLEVTFTATDICGNAVSCTKKITVSGSGTDTPLEVPQDTAIECGDPIPSPWYNTYGCVPYDVSYHEAKEPYSKCEYDLIRTWKAKDDCGNEILKTQKIKVRDTQGPSIIPPKWITDNLDDGVMKFYGCETPEVPMSGVKVKDNCCVDIYKLKAFDILLARNACDRYGFHTKWRCGYQITDEAGNESIYSFDVIQFDTTPPVMHNFPPDLDLECGAYIPPAKIDAVKVSDNCSRTLWRKYHEDVKINPNDAAQKVILRTWSFKDKCGNRTSRTQVIRVCGYDWDGSASGRIASSAWLDDGNGLQDEHELGLNNVRVLLYREGAARHDTVLLDSTSTSTHKGIYGCYEFNNLSEGMYTLRFETPPGFSLTRANVGGEDMDGMDSDPEQATGIIRRVEIKNGQVIEDLDAGFVQEDLVGEGPTYFQDIQEPTDQPIAPRSFGTDRNLVPLDLQDTGEGWEEVPAFVEMSLSPNPTTGRVKVHFDASSNLSGKILVQDHLGRRMQIQTVRSQVGFNEYELDLQAYPAGIYLVRLILDDQQKVMRVVKK